ncbi:YkvA family protein [uncultured Robinsoniella sp.]|uniref:YkvA family protein n=1 Tax=uncultured Robinsoniella sp. TaxID=904190 RepID=UPI00374F712B
MKLKEKAILLKNDIPAVFLCLKDKKTPIAAKILAGITIGYILSPIDFIPDFIPFLGYLDDVIIVPLLVALIMKLIPKETFEKYRRESKDIWKSGKPKHWYFAIPIIVMWLLILWFIIKAIFF